MNEGMDLKFLAQARPNTWQSINKRQPMWVLCGACRETRDPQLRCYAKEPKPQRSARIKQEEEPRFLKGERKGERLDIHSPGVRWRTMTLVVISI